MSSHKKQIAIGAILSYVHIAVGAVITLLYTPFMIRTLGKSEYGLYNTVASVISSLSILSLGFGSGYIRFFSRYKAEERNDDIAKLNGMFLAVFSIIGMVALACGVFLSNHLDMIFDTGLSQQELETARILMLMLTVNLTISFPASVFSSIITSHERFIFQKTIILVKQILSPLVCIPLLLMGYASVGMVASTVLISLIIDAVNISFCFCKLQTHFIFHNFPIQVFKELAVYSGFIAINMIVDQINLHIDKILLGRFCGTASVAVYSAGYALYSYYHSFSTSISNVFTPRIHHIWSNVKIAEDEKNRQLSKIFADVGRLQFLILWLVCSGLIIFGRQFIRLWAGNDYGNAYYVVILLSVSAIVPLSQNTGIEIQRAKNKHQFRSILYLFMALVNLGLSIYLCQLYGEIGSAIGTAVSFIVANTIIMDLFYNYVLRLQISEYWKKCIRILVSTLPAVIIGVIFCNLVSTLKLIPLIIGIAIYTSTYLVCIYIGVLNFNEKKTIQKKLVAICHGRK